MKFTEARDIALNKGELCDHCLGRLVSLAFKGNAVEQVGAALRVSKKDSDIPKNLKKKLKIQEKKCSLCGGLFAKNKKVMALVLKRMKEQEFETFLMGCKLPEGVQEHEEFVWTLVGTDNAEPIKREINRTLGKALEKKSKKRVDFDNPDVIFTVDYEEDSVGVQINSLFIYGKYRKLIRGIPQTKWPCRECHGRGCKRCGGTGKMYQETVEELVAEKAIKETHAVASKFHGKGREDIDALMLGDGRPFVLELVAPKKRIVDLKKLEKKINAFTKGKVEISGFRLSSMNEVRELKSAESEKVYECIVECKGVTKADVDLINKTFINAHLLQRTPTRVAHRRSDLVRKKVIKSVKAVLIDKAHFKAVIEASSGTYIKELVSGDNSRTKPSFTELLGKPCACVELNVVEVRE
ncbi:tRNA pseudouridine(54/55) synthase Pus10 [Candidatus Micrarchaeota archaeon]|nr:tRNA pseudouridine(54/55) synthase Pus10 [Candidatus Micrarchaeota archaeon]